MCKENETQFPSTTVATHAVPSLSSHTDPEQRSSIEKYLGVTAVVVAYVAGHVYTYMIMMLVNITSYTEPWRRLCIFYPS